jgi:hypothetical protein
LRAENFSTEGTDASCCPFDESQSSCDSSKKKEIWICMLMLHFCSFKAIGKKAGMHPPTPIFLFPKVRVDL